MHEVLVYYSLPVQACPGKGVVMSFPCHTHILIANSDNPDDAMHCLSRPHERMIDFNGLQFNRGWHYVQCTYPF